MICPPNKVSMTAPDNAVSIDMNVGLKYVIICSGSLTVIYLFLFMLNNSDYNNLGNKYLPPLIAYFHGYAVYKRLRYNKLFVWTPETWFLISSGIHFGLGSVILFYGSDEAITSVNLLYYLDDLLLLKTNLLNSVTIFIIIGTFMFYSKLTYFHINTREIIDSIESAKKICFIFFALSAPLIIALTYQYFLVPGSIAQTDSFTSAGLVILFYLWGIGDKKMAKWAIIVLTIMSLASMASFGKTVFLINFLYAALGILMSRTNIKIKHVAYVSIILISLLVWYKPISEAGRSSQMHLERFSERFDFTTNYILGSQGIDTSGETSYNIIDNLQRQSLCNIQGFLINRYDHGQPGDSFNDLWLFFIPRLLWPEKPITSDVAREMTDIVFGYRSSALAPSFNGDAYWNGGWTMVLLVSLYIGAFFTITSRNCIKHMSELDFRYLPIAIMGLNLGRYIEGFFTHSYIGGVVIMAVWWLILKRVFPVSEASLHSPSK